MERLVMNDAQSAESGTVSNSSLPRKRQARSNNGCGNCKKRKIKCDERKPGCVRCQTKRLKCPGYAKDKFKWSCKHEVYKPPSRPVNSNQEPYLLFSGPMDVNFAEPEGYSYIESPGDGDSVHAGPSPSQFRNTGSARALPSTSISGTISHLSSLHTSDSESHPDEGADARDPTSDHNHEDSLQPYQRSNAGYGTPASGHGLHVSDQDTTSSTYSYAVSSALSPTSNSSPVLEKSFVSSIPNSLLHVPTVLVEHYFQRVCRDCSTFDSSHNPFRTMVSEMRTKSATLNYTIQSLAAAKLVDDLPSMRVAGIEAQGLALESLRQDCSAVSALEKTSGAVLCTILLLGMTTSWHFPDDLGLEYLALARRIVTAKAQAQDTGSDLEFYQNAVMYWTMIVSIVSGKVEPMDAVKGHHTTVFPSKSLLRTKKIMPHPWTGISPVPQEIFGETLRLIRKTRDRRSKATPTYCRASIQDMFITIGAAEKLEAACWKVVIPSVDQLSEFGDPDTPRLHHVLTAKAYLLSSLLQLYTIFPDVLHSRIKAVAAEGVDQRSLDEGSNPSGHVLSTNDIWPRRQAGDPRRMWLRDIGIRIVECLEQIDVKSSTRVVHPPLLLTVATALDLSRQQERGSREPYNAQAGKMTFFAEEPSSALEVSEDAKVQHCRVFIINRLETMHALMRFGAIQNVITVVREVWRRADAGSGNVFWMDVMHELRCETLFG